METAGYDSSRPLAEQVAQRIQNLQYSLATAVGLFKSVISVILIALGYWLADKFTGYKLF